MTKPRTYTDRSVLKGILEGAAWADPTMDPAEIDWDERLKYAAIPFEVRNGRPINPRESTGVRYGRNELGHWGEQLCADVLALAGTPAGERYALMVERDDGHGWALPGGYIDPGESPRAAAIRELDEETGLERLSGMDLVLCMEYMRWPTWHESEPRYVSDPRASDEAWMVTVLCTLDLGTVEELPPVEGGDDATRAEWIGASSYEVLAADVAKTYGGIVFPAHVDILTAAL